MRYFKNTLSSAKKYEPDLNPNFVARVFRVDESVVNSELSKSGNDCNAQVRALSK